MANEAEPLAPTRRGLRVEDAIKLSGIGEFTIRKAIKDGTLRAIRLGKKRIIIPLWALDDWMRELAS